MKIPAIGDIQTRIKTIKKISKQSKATELKPIKNYTQYMREYGLNNK